ncbi:MAG: sensor histidine kinase, partial [Pseudomonadota bacterium]
AISEVRRISRDLRPGILDDLGLGPAVKTLAEDFEQRTGIKTHFKTVVFRNRLDPEAKTALYRIAQEALTNIERHAAATEVSVDLRGHKRGATLRIADNGVGIAPEARRAAGLGLRNMQERVEQLDGTMRLLSAKGTGTVIEATVPLAHLLAPNEIAEKEERAKA